MQRIAFALTAVAFLAVSTIARAETTFYGSFRVSIQYNDPDASDQSSNWDVTDHSSRIGVRGSEDLGNGLSTIYQLETRVRADEFNGNGDGFTGRLAWVGLNTGFGAVKIGAQWTPYYNVVGITDVFNADSWFRTYQGPFRQNNALVYETPDSIGFAKGEIMLVMDGAQGKDDIDTYNLGASFNFGPVYFGATYLSDEVADQDQWAIAASFGVADFDISGIYEDYEDGKAWQLVGEYDFGTNTLRAAYGQNRRDDDSNLDEWAVGLEHRLSNRTRVWIEYGDQDEDEGQLSVGMRHDF